MNLKELFQEIESYKFAAYLGIASDLKTFLRIAQQQKVVHALLDALKSVKSQQRVISRIHELSRDEVDPKYRNRWDTALAVYVWAVGLSHLERGQVAAEISLNAQHTWWTTRVAHQVLQEYQTAKVPSDAKMSSEGNKWV